MSHQCSCGEPKQIPSNPELNKIIEKYQGQSGPLIPILHAAQRKLGFLSRETMIQVAEALHMPLSEVYSTASFYTFLHIKPKGKHIIRVCESPACYVEGTAEVVKAIIDLLKIRPGETTADGRFTLEFTSCLGACNLAPAVMIDEEIIGELTPVKIKKTLEALK